MFDAPAVLALLQLRQVQHVGHKVSLSGSTRSFSAICRDEQAYTLWQHFEEDKNASRPISNTSRRTQNVGDLLLNISWCIGEALENEYPIFPGSQTNINIQLPMFSAPQRMLGLCGPVNMFISGGIGSSLPSIKHQIMLDPSLLSPWVYM